MYERKCKNLCGVYMKCFPCPSSPVDPIVDPILPQISGVGDFWYYGHGIQWAQVAYYHTKKDPYYITLH